LSTGAAVLARHYLDHAVVRADTPAGCIPELAGVDPAGTPACGGCNPLTGRWVTDARVVQHTLLVMVAGGYI
jgi:hypothetical protein